MAGQVPPTDGIGTQPAFELPLEPDTIELRADGSVTVAGHRVRLRQVVEAIGSGADLNMLADQFPTIEKPLLARVAQYVAKFPIAISRFMAEQRDREQFYSALGTHVSIEELRRLARQVR